jgi:hypothetical protein
MRLRFLRRTPPSCIHLDEATLLGLATGTGGADVEEAAAHLATCAPCTTRFTAVDPLASLFSDLEPPASEAPAAVFRLAERPAVRRRWTLPTASLALAAVTAALLLTAHVTPAGAPASAPPTARITALASAVVTASRSGDPVQLRRALAALDDTVRRLAGSEADSAAVVAALQNARSLLLGLPAVETAAALADVDAALLRRGAVEPTDRPCGSVGARQCGGAVAPSPGPAEVIPAPAEETPSPADTPGSSPDPSRLSGADPAGSTPTPSSSPSPTPDSTSASSNAQDSPDPTPTPS